MASSVRGGGLSLQIYMGSCWGTFLWQCVKSQHKNLILSCCPCFFACTTQILEVFSRACNSVNTRREITFHKAHFTDSHLARMPCKCEPVEQSAHTAGVKKNLSAVSTIALFGNLLPDTKRLLIKQTSYCARAQSKSKSPPINKKGGKKILFALRGPRVGKSFYPPAEKEKSLFKSSCPSSKSQK